MEALSYLFDCKFWLMITNENYPEGYTGFKEATDKLRTVPWDEREQAFYDFCEVVFNG